MDKLWVVCIDPPRDVYGGSHRCMVYASSKEKAIEKGNTRYPITIDNYRDEPYRSASDVYDAVEIKFDTDVSNLWYESW